MTLLNVDTPYWILINYTTVSGSNVMSNLAMAVLGSAYSWTVAREVWFNVFFHTLSDEDKNLVKISKSNRTFCFGDGVEVKSTKVVKFPVTIGSAKSVRAYIEAGIVKNDLPLLISYKSMKLAGMVLDFFLMTAVAF